MKEQDYNRGFLMAIEGIDGAGKSTQADLVRAALESRGVAVLRSREPTDGHWGRILRRSALEGRLSVEEEVDAFINDRKEHVRDVIRPALEAGKVVILDRYYFSNAAYQGARGYDPETILLRNEAFAPQPDLLVLLDVEPTIGLDRVRGRCGKADEFEKGDSLLKVRAIFQAIQRPYVYRVDARLPPDRVRDMILERYEDVVRSQRGS